MHSSEAYGRNEATRSMSVRLTRLLGHDVVKVNLQAFISFAIGKEGVEV
jgi:hypothetical protein